MSSQKQTRITWLGHSTLLIQTIAGTNFLVDPFIEQNPKYPKDFTLPSKIDYILLTHGHFDHIADAAPMAKKHGSKVVAIYELANYIAGKGVRETIGMNLGGTVQLDDVAATMVEARHSAGAQDENGVHYVGCAAGYVLTIASGPTVYLAGDTSVFGDMKLIGELYQPSLAVLPIGDHFTMGPRQAAIAARFVGVTTVLPVHWGTFPALSGTPEETAKHVGAGVTVVHWKPGEEIVF